MKPVFGESLDDVLLEDGDTGFAGVDTESVNSQMKPGMLRHARNVLIGSDFAVRSRPGFRRWSETVARNSLFYAYGGKECLLCFFANIGQVSMDEIDADGHRENFPTGISTPIVFPPVVTDYKFSFDVVQFVDRVFFNLPGGGLGWARWNGATSQWQFGSVMTDVSGVSLPVFSSLCVHGFRVFASVYGSDEVWVSKVLSAHETGVAGSWDAVQGVIRVGDGIGDFVVCLVSGQRNDLVVFLRASVYVINTSAGLPSGFDIIRLSNTHGCIAPKTAFQVGQEIFFLSREGVFVLSSLSQENSISQSNLISQSVRAYVDYVESDQGFSPFAFVYNGFYVLCLGRSMAVIFNVRTKLCSGIWNSILIRFDDFAKTFFGGEERTFFAYEGGFSGSGAGLFEIDSGHVGDQSGIDPEYFVVEVVSRPYFFGDQTSLKRMFSLELEQRKQDAYAFMLRVFLDPGFWYGNQDHPSGPNGVNFAVDNNASMVAANVNVWNLFFKTAVQQRLSRAFCVYCESMQPKRFELRRVAVRAFDNGVPLTNWRELK
jgi:hypothetical protein